MDRTFWSGLAAGAAAAAAAGLLVSRVSRAGGKAAGGDGGAAEQRDGEDDSLSPRSARWAKQRDEEAIAAVAGGDTSTAARYRALLESTQSISAEASFRDAIERVITVATHLVGADRVTLFIVEGRAGGDRVLTVGVSKGGPRSRSSGAHGALSTLRLRCDESSIVGYAACTGEVVAIDDAYADPRFDPGVDKETGYRTRSILAVPLKDAAGEVIAVVQAVNKVAADGDGPATFTSEDRFLLRSVADFAGGVLHKLTLHEESVRARRRTESLIYLMRTVAAETEPGRMIEQIIKVSYHLLDAERVTLFLVDADAEELVIAESVDAEGIRVPLTTGLAGYVATHGTALNIADAYADPRFDPTVDAATGFRTRSVLCVPVPDSDGTAVAVLQAINKGASGGGSGGGSAGGGASGGGGSAHGDDDDGGSMGSSSAARRAAQPFDAADARVLEYMAGHAGIMLRKAQLAEETRRARRATEALLGVVKLVAREEDINTLVAGIVKATEKLLEAERVSLFLVDPIKEELWMAVSQDAAGVRVPIGTGLAGWVAQHGESINVRDAYDDERFNPAVDASTGFRTRSVLGVPVQIVGGGPPLAVLMAINRSKVGGGVAAFTRRDEEALVAFSTEVALALKRKSVEAAFAKVLQDGRAGGAGEQSFSVSLLALYSDTATKARLRTSVLVRSLSVEHELEWPSTTPPKRRRSSIDGGEGAGGAGGAAQGSTYSASPSVVPGASLSDELRSWALDVFAIGEQRQLLLLQGMFEEFGLLKHFAVPHDTLHALILGARAKYRADNAFHNFYHAFSVTHATFLVLVSTPALHCLTHVEVMAVLVAALCHDIDHPGHNNAYEINSSSELAIRHNDDAVLERHHAHTTFELLQSADGSRNIFAAPRVSAAQWRRARRVIVEAILATDMSKHFGMIAELSERIAERTGATSLPDASPSLFADSAGVADRARSTSEAHLTLPSLLRTPNWGRMSSTDTVGSRKAKGAVPTKHEWSSDPATFAFHREDDAERLELVRTLVHAADLSGQAYPPAVARQWGERVVREFREQAAKERRHGLPVAPFMAELDTPSQVAKLQLSFIDNVVLPLWEAVSELLPGLRDPLDNLYANRLANEAALLAAERAERAERAES